jgi:hypothetical protein
LSRNLKRRLDDLGAWRSFAQSGKVTLRPADMVDTPPGQLDVNLLGMMQDPTCRAVTLVWRNGALIGLATMSMVRSTEFGLISEIQDPYVLPEARLSGAARAGHGRTRWRGAVSRAARRWTSTSPRMVRRSTGCRVFTPDSGLQQPAEPSASTCWKLAKPACVIGVTLHGNWRISWQAH